MQIKKAQSYKVAQTNETEDESFSNKSEKKNGINRRVFSRDEIKQRKEMWDNDYNEIRQRLQSGRML